MADLVTARTRRALQESYVRHAVLRVIQQDFDDAGVPRRDLPPTMPISGERRTLVEEYYSTVDWGDRRAVRRVLDAYESHLFRLSQDRDDACREEAKVLTGHLEADDLSYINRKINLRPATIVDEHLIDETLTVDVSQLKSNIKRMQGAVVEDPALAIGASKELVEACCKACLVDLGEEVGRKETLPDLMKRLTRALELVPEGVPEEKKGAASIRRVLGSLANIVQGMAELRNSYGSGPGKAPGQGGLHPRHARLSVGAASTLSMFLMETVRARRDQG